MAGTALACAWISLPAVAIVPVAAGIALAWVLHLAQALQRGKRAVRALELDAQGGARWQDRSEHWREAEILPGSYASDWLIVVIMRDSGGRRCSVVIPPDGAAAEELRRLRAWLRWRLSRA